MMFSCSSSACGLSPLARGNLSVFVNLIAFFGPIPARTGQPKLNPSCAMLAGAYPRSHGATQDQFHAGRALRGLSPLARGNQLMGVRIHHGTGPIPARTGQPRYVIQSRFTGWAYPRSHGATIGNFNGLPSEMGLSPLARGNRAPGGKPCKGEGPIPARTGQPLQGHAGGALRRAYPRSHGATPVVSSAILSAKGLSPLARGNRRSGTPQSASLGPIPARTGQPPGAGEDGGVCGAYPRSHGATAAPELPQELKQGLSPLARGNPTAAQAALESPGLSPLARGNRCAAC